LDQPLKVSHVEVCAVGLVGSKFGVDHSVEVVCTGLLDEVEAESAVAGIRRRLHVVGVVRDAERFHSTCKIQLKR